MLNDFDSAVRDTLCEVIGSESTGLSSNADWVDDPTRCRNRLYDSHPDAGLEVRLLYLAHRMGVPDSLRTGRESDSKRPDVPLFEAQKLADTLRQNNGLTRRAARWAVGVWADALGVDIQDRGKKFDSPAIISFDAEPHPESEDGTQVIVRWNVWGKHDRITLTPPGVDVDSRGKKSLRVDRQTSYQLCVHNDGKTLHASAIAGRQLSEGEEPFSEYRDYISSFRGLLVHPVRFGKSLNCQRIFLYLEKYREGLLEERVWGKNITGTDNTDKESESENVVEKIFKVIPSSSIYIYTVFVNDNTYPAFADMQNNDYLFLKMYVSGFYLISGLAVNYYNIWSYGYKNEDINDKYLFFILFNIIFAFILLIEW